MTRASLSALFLVLIQALSATSYAQSDIESACAKDGYDLYNRIGSPFSYNTH